MVTNYSDLFTLCVVIGLMIWWHRRFWPKGTVVSLFAKGGAAVLLLFACVIADATASGSTTNGTIVLVFRLLAVAAISAAITVDGLRVMCDRTIWKFQSIIMTITFMVNVRILCLIGFEEPVSNWLPISASPVFRSAYDALGMTAFFGRLVLGIVLGIVVIGWLVDKIVRRIQRRHAAKTAPATPPPAAPTPPPSPNNWDEAFDAAINACSAEFGYAHNPADAIASGQRAFNRVYTGPELTDERRTQLTEALNELVGRLDVRRQEKEEGEFNRLLITVALPAFNRELGSKKTQQAISNALAAALNELAAAFSGNLTGDRLNIATDYLMARAPKLEPKPGSGSGKPPAHKATPKKATPAKRTPPKAGGATPPTP